MAFVRRTRVKPILPHVPGVSKPDVVPTRIVCVCPTEGIRQTADRMWNRQQVHMIAHQAVARDPYCVASTVLAQQLEVRARSAFSKNTVCRRFPRCVTWCQQSGTTMRAILAID